MAGAKPVLENLSDAQREELRQTEERLRKAVAERRAGSKNLKGERHFEQTVGSLTFRYETVRCGKENCTKCPHGPYWYVYWKENGRTRSRYIGRTLPAPAQQSYEEKRRARLERERG